MSAARLCSEITCERMATAWRHSANLASPRSDRSTTPGPSDWATLLSASAESPLPPISSISLTHSKVATIWPTTAGYAAMEQSLVQKHSGRQLSSGSTEVSSVEPIVLVEIELA